MDSDHTQFGRNLYFQKKKKWVKVLNSESGSEPLEESLEMKGSCDSASYTSTLKKKKSGHLIGALSKPKLNKISLNVNEHLT